MKVCHQTSRIGKPLTCEKFKKCKFYIYDFYKRMCFVSKQLRGGRPFLFFQLNLLCWRRSRSAWIDRDVFLEDFKTLWTESWEIFASNSRRQTSRSLRWSGASRNLAVRHTQYYEIQHHVYPLRIVRLHGTDRGSLLSDDKARLNEENNKKITFREIFVRRKNKERTIKLRESLLLKRKKRDYVRHNCECIQTQLTAVEWLD